MAKLPDTFITQAYLRRWPDSKRSRSWAGRMVHIHTENGVWRTGGAGYTWAGKPDAWVLPFEEAQREVNHCGPEKQAAFIRALTHRCSMEALRIAERWLINQGWRAGFALDLRIVPTITPRAPSDARGKSRPSTR